MLWKEQPSWSMLSIVLIYQKVIIRFFKLFFSFVVVWWVKEILNSFIGYIHCSLALRVIMYSIYSTIPFDSQIFPENCFWTHFIYRSDVNQKYYVWRCIFKAVKIVLASLWFNGISHPYFVKWSTIVKIYSN